MKNQRNMVSSTERCLCKKVGSRKLLDPDGALPVSCVLPIVCRKIYCSLHYPPAQPRRSWSCHPPPSGQIRRIINLDGEYATRSLARRPDLPEAALPPPMASTRSASRSAGHSG